MELKSLTLLKGETVKSHQAFLDYIDMGHQRSLPKLMAQYDQMTTERPPCTQIKTLKTWSSKFDWQHRLMEYQNECQSLAVATQREAYNQHIQRALPLANRLMTQMETMLDNFQQMRITSRSMIPDPRDPTRQRMIESIQHKVNTRDLRDLSAMFGQLSKDMRTMLGVPTMSESKVENVGQVMKAYINVSPDDWDNAAAPDIPDIERPPELPAETPDED